jgi:hypothetical protein
MKKSSIIATLALSAATFAAHAQYLELNISADCNQNLQTFPDGHEYPLGGTQIDVGGIPFGLSMLDNIPGTTGVVQTPADNQSYTFNVPSDTSATVLYALMNTSWSDPNIDEGCIIVTGSHGESATLGLGTTTWEPNGGVNSGGLNVQPEIATGPVELDREELVLPCSFDGDTIASITFDGIDNGGTNSDPFLAGVTLAVVPEPSAFLLIGLGAMILGARLTRQHDYWD